jgi:hypothetical protein
MKQRLDNLKSVISVLFSFIMIVLLLTSCASSVNVRLSIQSDPSGALVIKHDNDSTVDDSPTLLDNVFNSNLTGTTEYVGTTPCKTAVRFETLSRKYLSRIKRFITIEKRGYRKRTIAITMNSDTLLSIKLERIDSLPETIFDNTNLQSAKFLLLPIVTEIDSPKAISSATEGYLHHYYFALEIQPEESFTASKWLQADLEKVFDGAHKVVIPFSSMDDSIKTAYTKNISERLKNDIFSLNSKQFAYYSFPPRISSTVGGFNSLAEKIRGLPKMDNVLFLYIFCQSVVGTKLSSQFSLDSLNQRFDPNPNKITSVTVAVIDPKSLEVVFLYKNRFRMALNHRVSVEQLARSLQNFPAIDTVLSK